MCRFALGSALCAHKRHQAEVVFRKEHYICKTASCIELQNQDAICENILCVRESMAESIDHTPAKLSAVKMRHFQMFEKACRERWPFVTTDGKGDTCVDSEILL